jgi:hypothetical protein
VDEEGASQKQVKRRKKAGDDEDEEFGADRTDNLTSEVCDDSE